MYDPQKYAFVEHSGAEDLSLALYESHSYSDTWGCAHLEEWTGEQIRADSPPPFPGHSPTSPKDPWHELDDLFDLGHPDKRLTASDASKSLPKPGSTLDQLNAKQDDPIRSISTTVSERISPVDDTSSEIKQQQASSGTIQTILDEQGVGQHEQRPPELLSEVWVPPEFLSEFWSQEPKTSSADAQAPTIGANIIPQEETIGKHEPELSKLESRRKLFSRMKKLGSKPSSSKTYTASSGEETKAGPKRKRAVAFDFEAPRKRQ